MFGKSKFMKESSGAEVIETVIGAGTVVQGTISSKGAIRIDGKVEGSVSESAAIIIGEHGEIQGDLNSHSVVVGGKITGNIVASSSLEILANAHILGDIKTASLNISEGATFEGNCTMTKEKQVIEMDVPGAAKGRR